MSCHPCWTMQEKQYPSLVALGFAPRRFLPIGIHACASEKKRKEKRENWIAYQQLLELHET